MGRNIVIIGGGVIGSAIAYFLLADPKFQGEVTVIERDPGYREASSALSASSIRQQFSTAINIEICKASVAFLRRAGAALAVDGEQPQVGLVEGGYLFLASADGEAAMRRNHELQRAHGVDVVLLSPGELTARFPWLSTEGVALGSLGLAGEGWFDGWSLLQGFRKKARALGARYIEAEAGGMQVRGGRVEAVQLADGSSLACDLAVNAAGPWARRVAGWADIDLPVHARRRCMFVFTSPARLAACPLVIDTSGVYFRPEGAGYICGVSPDAQHDPDDAPLEVDHALFEDVIWPALARRVPGFEALRQTSAWAGYYEYNSFDHNAVIGAHPAITNLIFANGFSGHGMQQSPAIGRGVAELIAHGGYRSLDLAELGFERIIAGQPILEQNVI